MQDTKLKVGSFSVLKKLGEGAHGTSYLVRKERQRSHTVLKALRDRAGLPAPDAQRADRLARDVARLEIEHPNLVAPAGSGLLPGADLEGSGLYLLCDYVEGPDLYRFSARSAWSTILEVIVSALRGLEALHSRGLLHGHLVASNVIVSGQGPRKSARLVDGGLALDVAETRALDAGVRSWAPEALLGEPLDRRADLYDFGVLLFECATRAPLFSDDDPAEVRRAHLEDAPRKARELKRSVPVAVEGLIDALLKKDPAERPPSANALIRELNRAANKRFSTETREVRLAAPLIPALTGRSDELDELRAWTRATRAEERGGEPVAPAVLVEADPGQGRTRLLGELRRRAAAPGHARLAWVEPADPTLAGLLDAVAPIAREACPGALAAAARFLQPVRPGLFPDVRPAPPLPDGDRHRVLEAAARLLLETARARPLVVAVDDAHAADALLIEALTLAVRDLHAARGAAPAAEEPAEPRPEDRDLPAPTPDAPLAIVLTVAPDELFGRPAEPALGALRARPGVRPLPLEPLAPADLGALLASALGRDRQEVRAVTQRCADAPGAGPAASLALLAELGERGAVPAPDGAWTVDEEVVEAAVADAGLPAVLARRLEAANASEPQARDLATALALHSLVAPRPARVDLLAQALEVEVDEVRGAARELERRGLVRPLTGGEVRLTGVSIAEAVLAQVPPPAQAVLREALGRAAADAALRCEAREAVELLAAAGRHLLQSDRPGAGTVPSAAAAAALLERRDPHAAVALLEPALKALEAGAPAEELDLPEALRLAGPVEVSGHQVHADALLRLGRAGPARTAAQKAFSAARTARLPREMAAALLSIAAANEQLADVAQAKSASEEAVRLATGSDWRRGLVGALRARAAAERAAGDRDEALASLEEARKTSEALGDRAAQADLLAEIAALRLAQGGASGALEACEQALELAEESDSAARLAAVLRLRARVQRELGQVARADRTARRAVQAARDALDVAGVAEGAAAVAAVLLAQGDAEGARAREELALSLWERLDDGQGMAETRMRLGRILLACGSLSGAEVQLTQSARAFKQMDRARTAEVNTNLARTHLLGGDIARARDAVDRALEDAQSTGDARSIQEARCLRAEIALVQGDLAGAEEQAAATAEESTRSALPVSECQARVLYGWTLLRRGRPVDAERELRDAFDLARERADSTLQARARLGIAQVHMARGEPAGSLGELEKARDVAQTQQDVQLELLSLLALGRLHLFLGQAKRAASLMEMAWERAGELELTLYLPEAALLEAQSLIGQATAGEGDPDAALLDAAAAKLDEAEKRCASRRLLRAEVDATRADLCLVRGDAAGARERAGAALEAAKVTGDTLLGLQAELLFARLRRAQGRHEEALQAAERAYQAAEPVREGEAHAEALLWRGRARQALGQLVLAAHDLREAASHVRGIWAALPEDLREDYQGRRLVREVAVSADEITTQVEAIAPPPEEAPAPAAAPAAAAPPGEPGAAAPASEAPARSPAEALLSEPPTAQSADSLESLRDPLTNLFNHTFFTAQLETEIKRAQRHSRPLALLKINIDRFKLVRELYGPKTGKKIIREVAQLLLRHVRDVDIVARYFGDEFELLLPDTDQRGALLTAERIREATEGYRFEHEDEKIELTLTIGVAVFPRDAKDRDAIICRADEALYNARSRGSNSVFTFGGEEEVPLETSPELREVDQLMLTREGRTILSMVNRLVNQELDIDRVIELVTGMVVEATRGERGFIILKGPDGEFSFRHGRNIDDKVINSPELKISNGIAKDVASTGGPVMVQEALEDDRFRDFKSVMDLGLRSIICAPISVGDEALGVIYVDHNQVARNFTQEDLNFLTAIADKVAIPLKNSKKLRETEDRLAMAEARLKTAAAQLETKYRYDQIIGRTEAMQKVFKLLDRIVETNHSVVIHGESGTGKELIARAIHYNGPRKQKPFVAENCAALSETLLEAELFGHVKGAFTGADRDSKGLFELANGGTLFLDEIGDMSERMQKKLLRVLQEGEVRPVGGKRVFHVDVRIISASNKDLKRLVSERKFREDLYYRLNVITVNLPPLRERREDIVLLAEHFLAKHDDAGQGRDLDRETLRYMVNYDWPGNVRELENEVSRLVAMSDDLCTPDLLSPKVREGSKTAEKGGNGLSKYYNRPLKDVEHEFMRDVIVHTLNETNWHRTKAAKILKVPTSTLFNKMKKYNIEQ